MRKQVFEYSSCDGGRCGRDTATQLVHEVSLMGCHKGQLPSPTTQHSLPQKAEDGGPEGPLLETIIRELRQVPGRHQAEVRACQKP